MSRGGNGLRGSLLISHTHWDHIQGIPFFDPLFARGAEWDVYGPNGPGASLREALAGQMQYDYFPVTLDEFGARKLMGPASCMRAITSRTPACWRWGKES